MKHRGERGAGENAGQGSEERPGRDEASATTKDRWRGETARGGRVRDRRTALNQGHHRSFSVSESPVSGSRVETPARWTSALDPRWGDGGVENVSTTGGAMGQPRT